MEFLLEHDWLHREGPSYAFLWDHFLVIVLMIAIGVFLAFFLRKKSHKAVKITIITLWGIGAAICLFYRAFIYSLCITKTAGYVFNIETMLPLHSCLMFYYVFPFAIFVKNKYIKVAANNFLVVVNMIMGFITLFVGCPGDGNSAFSFFGLQTLLYHGIIVIVPFIMLVTKYYDLKKEDLKFGLLTFAALGLTVYIFDAITGCDYFYFYDGHTFPVFKFISENVPKLVWTLVVVSAYVLTAIIIHYLIVFIKHLIHKNEIKAEENN